MHNIIHWTYPEKTDIIKIEKDVVNYVMSHGDRYGTMGITPLTNAPFENQEQAEAYIRERDNGYYAGYAVKFYDYSKAKNTKKMDELNAKIDETFKKRDEYISTHHVKDFKASFIGCSKCGSKLSRQHLNSDKCPVCYNDLRAESTLERIANFDKRIKEYQAKIKQEIQKQKDKADIKWLVKFEYHS